MRRTQSPDFEQYRFAHIRSAHEMLQVSPFDGILEQSRDLIIKRLDLAIAGMLDKADETLSAFFNETQDREERELIQKARDVTLTRREAIQTQFRARYMGNFRQCSNRARKIGHAFGDVDCSLGSLTIVSDDDLRDTLKFNDMVAKLRAYCDEELLALDQRVGVLLGDANLQADDNPFSPQVICDAFKHACREADPDTGVRRLLLKLFDDHVLDDIRSVYKAINALLVQKAILPKIRYGVSRKEGRKAPAPDAPVSQTAAAGAPAPAANAGTAQDLFSMLQNLVASNAGAIGPPVMGGGGAAAGAQAGASGPTTILQGAELLGSLTRIQVGDMSGVAGGTPMASSGLAGTTNILHELKGTSVGAGMGQMDLMTLDIVAMLFDQLFDDPKVPNGVKGLIGRLQIPMLKVAIADKSFFSRKSHPARQLLDTLGEIALRLPADFNTASPMFANMEGIVQGLVSGFEDNFEIFDAARDQLRALEAEEARRVEQENQAVVQRIEETEKLELARNEAQEELKERVQTHELPGPVLEFLIQQWLQLMVRVHVTEGKQSDAWKDAMETMDQLIWSVETKSTLDERRKLAAMVPGMIRKLAAGMATAGIEDEVRTQFFGDLMNYHTHAISAPLHGKPAPGTGRQTVAAVESAAAVDNPPGFSATTTARNPFRGAQASVDRPDAEPAEIDASGGGLPEDLAMGTWVEFRETGDSIAGRTAKLIFVSPRKTRYLFAIDRACKEIIQCTRAEISRRFRLGEAVVIDEPADESLFDRIMNGLVGKLRAPSGQH